jgi:histidinol-phosphate phosphatase family protein
VGWWQVNQLVILDRDGILNKLLVRPNGETDSPMTIDEIEVFPWVPDCIKQINELGFNITVASNQPASAKGKISLEQLQTIHNQIIKIAESASGKILGSYVCFHKKEDLCSCRKPKTGLLEQSFINHPNNTIEDSWMVGDRATDIIAGHSFNLNTAWLGLPISDDNSLLNSQNILPTFRGNDLRDFVRYLTSIKKQKVITFPCVDGDTGELIELQMDENAFIDWNLALDEEEKAREARQAELRKLESDNWKYVLED